MTNWNNILHDLSDYTLIKVNSIIPKRGKLPHNEFKNLLDRKAQESIIETLNKYKIDAELISEEGDKTFGEGKYIITADPVDGTTNLSRGLQPSVLSISVATGPLQNKVIAGIVTNFYSGDSYYAEKGKGATLNDTPIKPSPYIPYQRGLIGMDISKDPKIEKTASLISESRHPRQEGCSAASLCHVADGTLDAHIDLRGMLRVTDISAGLLIIKEAGGVYSINGKLFGDLPITRETRCTVIAANMISLHEEILNLIDP
jgi:myo-inositol-1(or 4)-monophosphatase